MKKSYLGLALLLSLFAFGDRALAGSHTWTGAAGSNWSVGGNWNLGVAPLSGETNVTLVFPTGQGNMATMVNDVTGLNVVSINFADTTYSVTGATINLNGALSLSGSGGSSLTPVSFGLPITLTGPSSVSANRSLILDGTISGSFGMTFLATDPGKITLTKNNLYTGSSTILGGSVYVNGSQPSSAFVISSTAGTQSFLRGTGTVGPISIGGGSQAKFVWAGDPSTTGVLTCNGGLNFTDVAAGNGGFIARLNGPTPGTGYDQVVVNGALNLGGASSAILFNFTPAMGASFPLIANDAADAVTGQFSGGGEGTVIWAFGPTVQITYHGGDGNDVAVVVLCPSDAAGPTVTAPTAATVAQTICS